MSDMRSTGAFPSGLRALPANLCPILRSILNGVRYPADDYLSRHVRRNARPKRQCRTDLPKQEADEANFERKEI
jgi:hypothetical protein